MLTPPRFPIASPRPSWGTEPQTHHRACPRGMARVLFGAEAPELERRGLAPCRCTELAELESAHPVEPPAQIVTAECIGCHRTVSTVNRLCLGCAFWGRVPLCKACSKPLDRGPIGGGHFDYLECGCPAAKAERERP